MSSTPIQPVRLLLLLCAVLLCAATAQAATVKTFGRSVQLQSIRAFDASAGFYNILWTTSDGLSSNVPRYYINAGFIYVSGELMQVNGDYFEAEYLVFHEASGLFTSYGYLSVTLPVTDANGNGFPDWMERDQSASITTTGLQYVNYPSSSFTLATMTFTRAAGSLTGAYTIQAGGAPTLAGTWNVLYTEGTVTVNRAANTAAFSVTGIAGTRTGTALLTFQGPNQITLPPFTATGAGKPPSSTVGNTVLLRSGNTYRGEATGEDGLSDSPWPDFLRSRWEITDTSDTDGDGIPDLSDALLALPAIVRQPVPRFDFPVTPGYTYRLRGSLDLKTWTDYATHAASGTVWQYTPPAGSRAFLKIVSP